MNASCDNRPGHHAVVAVIALLALTGAVQAAGPSNLPAPPGGSARGVAVTDAPSLPERVEQQIRAHLPVAGATIQVSEEQGQITLSGWVDAYAKRQIAQEIAESVRGVSAVVNIIVVRPEVQRNDEQIAESVRSALRADPATRDLAIDVSVENGVVSLAGVVKAQPQRRVAGWTASRLIGVRDVVNRIQVRAQFRSDDEIQQELQEHFATSPVFNENDLTVSVKDGVVKIAGQVDSALEKNWAETDGWIPGVRQVDASGLAVHFSPEGWRPTPNTRVALTDEQIRRAIERQFVYDPRVNSTEPKVAVQNGTVTLSGSVAYPGAKRAAVEIARDAGGVTDVIDHLGVRPPVRRSDEQIARAVRLSLLSNPLVHATGIDVQVTNGDVVLTGTVPDPLAKWTAGDLADRTAGTISVVNHLRAAHEPLPGADHYFFPRGYALRPWIYTRRDSVPQKTDAELASAIRAELAWSPFTDSSAVEATVARGVVTLTGEVKTWSGRGAAADYAFQAGARQVINRLRVGGDRRPTAAPPGP